MRKEILISLAIAAGLALASTQASAYEAGDWVLKTGISNVNPQRNAASVAGQGVTVDDATQFSVTGEYMFTSAIGVELLASLPFEHDISVGGVHVGSTKQLPPTVSVNYHFNSGGDFVPYVGAGINYTTFFSENTVNGNTVPGLGDAEITNLDLDDSWGLALQAGVDMKVRENTLLSLAVRWVDIDTDVDATLNGGPVASFNADIDPVILTLALGFQF
jgi:outer membrane protein